LFSELVIFGYRFYQFWILLTNIFVNFGYKAIGNLATQGENFVIWTKVVIGYNDFDLDQALIFLMPGISCFI